MNSASLQLNPVHTDLVKQFLDLAHYQLAQRIKSVRHSFSNLLTFKVRDTTSYTGEQVREMLIGLQEIVIDEIENELSNSNYTSTLLIQKLLQVAEEWHLTLNTTVTDLEDCDKLNVIKRYDEELRQSPEPMNITVEKSLVNWNGVSGSDGSSGDGSGSTKSIALLLKEKVTQLTVENELIKSKIKDLEFQLREATIEDEPTNTSTSPKSRKRKTAASLSNELAAAQEEIHSLRSRLDQLTNSKDNDLESIQESVTAMKRELESSRKLAEQQTEQLRHDLESREDKLRTVQSNLLLKEKELDQKFQATQAYLNMKKILVQKNCTIKELRQKLIELGHNFSANQEKEEENDNSVML